MYLKYTIYEGSYIRLEWSIVYVLEMLIVYL